MCINNNDITSHLVGQSSSPLNRHTIDISTYLLWVVGCEGHEWSDVEHHLEMMEVSEDTLLTSEVTVIVKATQETFEPLELHTLTCMWEHLVPRSQTGRYLVISRISNTRWSNMASWYTWCAVLNTEDTATELISESTVHSSQEGSKDTMTTYGSNVHT